MSDPAVALPPVGFKDRRTGLLVFGILVIILGGMLALLVPFMVLGQLMAGRVAGAQPMPLRILLPNVVLYLGMAAACIWLGIGSVKCRRWARALLLVLSWMGLICGVGGIVVVAFILPQVFAHPPAGSPPMPDAVRIVATVVALTFCGMIYIILPGVLVFFYRSPHVKATCEARDPVPRWTDACPLPVLAVSLILGLAAAMMPLLIGAYHSVVPCFGRYVNGAAGAAILLVLLMVYAWGAYANYKLRIAGWWVAMLGFGLWMLSAVVTFASVGLTPMYERMEFPKAQLDTMRQMGFLDSPWMPVMMLACWLPFLGFVAYTRKFFGK